MPRQIRMAVGEWELFKSLSYIVRGILQPAWNYNNLKKTNPTINKNLFNAINCIFFFTQFRIVDFFFLPRLCVLCNDQAQHFNSTNLAEVIRMPILLFFLFCVALDFYDWIFYVHVLFLFGDVLPLTKYETTFEIKLHFSIFKHFYSRSPLWCTVPTVWS